MQITWTPIKVAVATLAVMAVLAAAAIYEIAVWRECIADQPWWYCFRVLA